MHTPNNNVINLRELSKSMIGIAGLECQDLGLDRDQQYIDYSILVAMGLFRLVVMGEIKKGKSSFINALCGIENLVPVLSEVATSTIFKIRYGPRLRYRVFYIRKVGEERRTEEIAPEQVSDFGTETGNPANRKGVDFIAIEAPSPVLESGLVIVDTPGLGGLFKDHQVITFRHAPNSDGVFFITDSVESPLGNHEVKCIKELRQITNKIYFIQTKSDLVDEEVAIARKKNNIKILAEEAGLEEKNIVYFIVSSFLKSEADREGGSERDLEDSGFKPLMDYFNRGLKSNMDKNIAAVAVTRSKEKLRTLIPEIQWRRKMLDADSSEKRKTLETDIHAVQIRIQEWQSEELPELQRNFERDLKKSFNEAQTILRRKIGPLGEISQDANQAIDSETDAKSIYQKAPAVFENLTSEASYILAKTCKDLVSRVNNHIFDLGHNVQERLIEYMVDQDPIKGAKGEEISELVSENEITLERFSRKANENTLFEKTRSVLWGGKTGAVFGTIAVVGASFLTSVGALLAIPAVVYATIKGGKSAYSSRARREANSAQAEVRAAINEAVSRLYSQACDQFHALQYDLSSQADDSIRSLLKSANSTLANRKKTLAERSRQTNEELQALSLKQQELEKKAKGFIEHLAEVEESIGVPS